MIHTFDPPLTKPTKSELALRRCCGPKNLDLELDGGGGHGVQNAQAYHLSDWTKSDASLTMTLLVSGVL